MDNLNGVDFDNFEAVGRGSDAETKNNLDVTALDVVVVVVSEKKGNSFHYFDYLDME